MNKKYITELIYNLLDKGYSKDIIVYYIATTVARHVNIETIDRVYDITEKKWLKENKNGKEIYK